MLVDHFITGVVFQLAILDKVHEMTYEKNPKVWLGIELLSTYVNLRPGDLFKIREKDIDLKCGDITIHYPAKKKNNLKTVRLIPEHVQIFKEIKERFKAVPELKFFRHHGGVKSVKVNQPFGEKYFYKAWKAACEKFNIDGLDLYGGTRHTSTTEIKILAGEKMQKKQLNTEQINHLEDIANIRAILPFRWPKF